MKLAELCHIYWSDFLTGKNPPCFKKELALLLKEKSLAEKVKTIVLVDDHHLGENDTPPTEWARAELRDYFISENMPVDAFYFESDCSEFADIVLNRLPQENIVKSSFDRGCSSRTFYVKDGKRIPLFKETTDTEGNRTYTCPLLSAVWVLMKNDIIPVLKVAYKVSSLTTILHEKYRSTEDDVNYLLKEAGFEFAKPNKTVYY